MSKQTVNIKITPLGGGCEVGRSCILLEIGNKKILLDCGIHPSETSLASLPFFDRLDPWEIDMLLITHFHLDHCGAVPYFLERTSFKGKTFMTYPTKAIYKQILQDSLRIGVDPNQPEIFNKEDLEKSMEKIIGINFHEERIVNDVKFAAYNAGHVIGAAMFLIEYQGVKVLYTGDYSREKDIHIVPAEIPNSKIDVLIAESTYGIKCHEPREFREKLFLETVEKIVKRNGKCLLPVFVLGRAQELLLLLEEHWARHPELHNIPIYYASTMMTRCLLVFQTYLNMMGLEIQDKMRRGINPFDFKYINVLRQMDPQDQIGQAMVVMASPGMLQQGLSKSLFQKWCHDEKNGVLFTGYCVENTFARDILNGLREFTDEQGINNKIKMSVEYISFSAHADFDQTKDFIDKVKPSLVCLVHGEKHEAQRLKQKLESFYEGDLRVESPENWETIEQQVSVPIIINIQENLLIDSVKENNQNHQFLLIKNKEQYKIIDPKQDLFWQEKIQGFNQITRIDFQGDLAFAFYLIQQIIEESQILYIQNKDYIIVRQMITIYKDQANNQLVLQWQSSDLANIIGDCIGYMFYNVSFYDTNLSEQQKQQDQRTLLIDTLGQQFGQQNITINQDNLIITKNELKLLELNLNNKEIIYTQNDFIKQRLDGLLQLLQFPKNQKTYDNFII